MGGILVSSNYCKSLILQGEKLRLIFITSYVPKWSLLVFQCLWKISEYIFKSCIFLMSYNHIFSFLETRWWGKNSFYFLKEEIMQENKGWGPILVNWNLYSFSIHAHVGICFSIINENGSWLYLREGCWFRN